MMNIKIPSKTSEALLILRTVEGNMCLSRTGCDDVYSGILALVNEYTEAVQKASEYQKRAITAESLLLNVYEDLAEMSQRRQDDISALARAVGDVIRPFSGPDEPLVNLD